MTISDRKKREKKHRHQAILKSAKKLISKLGCEDMSMNQLAEATELNKATLYLYFSSKDDLIDAIVYEGLQILDTRLQEEEGRPASPLDRVLNQVAVIFSFYRENPVYFHTFNHQERRQVNVRAETPYSLEGNALAVKIFDRTAKAVESGIEQGAVRKEVDVKTFLILMYAYIYGVMHTIYSKADVYEDVLALDADFIEKSALDFIRHYLEK